MCGVTGFVNVERERPADEQLLARMTATLVHRGPDAAGQYVCDNVALGFRRLSIIDLAGGDQPLFSEDGSVVLVCNGEIFNHVALRAELERRGHTFRTRCDVEVLVHLYEEHGPAMLNRINGQFAFAIYDLRRRQLLLARDHVGILPMYFAQTRDQFVFGSEAKAILEHPGVERAVDLTGLDQVLTFPGLVSPRTMFRGISSLESGHYLVVRDGVVTKVRYWDLDYPTLDDPTPRRSESEYVETLRDLLSSSVRYRLQADVPVGYYLSGGLDSSLIAALVHRNAPTARHHSFSIAFAGADFDESKYQRLMAEQTSSIHHELDYAPDDIAEDLRRMVYHAETPVKESYNTCSMALSAAVRAQGVKVVLTGEGADELFGGYLGYRFDRLGRRTAPVGSELDRALEAEVATTLWGDPHVGYERQYHAWREAKLDLFSAGVVERFADVDCLRHPIVDPTAIRGRHPLHQRSYLDFKLRLSDHLLSDHGDRMALANSIEARYPFLDIDAISYATTIPPDLKVTDTTEKFIVRRVAEGLVPDEIVHREKFGFRAHGSSGLLRLDREWIAEIMSPDRIRRQGYFNADVVQSLTERYRRDGFEVHPHLSDDLVLVVLTFGIFLEMFNLPDCS